MPSQHHQDKPTDQHQDGPRSGSPARTDRASSPEAPRAPRGQAHLLLVTPNAELAEHARPELERHFGQGCLCAVQGIHAMKAIDMSRIDLVLTEMALPDGDGLDVLGWVLRQRADMPVVLVAEQTICRDAARAIHFGAYDYVVKEGEYLRTLPVIVEKSLAAWRTKRENTRLQQRLRQTLTDLRQRNRQLSIAVERLEEAAATDPLTGLGNRRAFNEALEREFARCQRAVGRTATRETDLACIMIDLDGFKQFNDAFGHQHGDRLLQAAARVLQANCRRSDVAGRFGGDEFVLLLPDTDLETARQVARRIADEFVHAGDRLQQKIARELTAQRRGENRAGGVMTPASAAEAARRLRYPVTMSMGLASLQHSRPSNGDQLVAHADHALYHAKQAGKRCLMLYGVSEAETDQTSAEHEAAPSPNAGPFTLSSPPAADEATPATPHIPQRTQLAGP